MCVQCVTVAVTAGAAATGLRGWVVVRYGYLMTPRRKRVMTSLVMVGGVLAAALVPPT